MCMGLMLINVALAVGVRLAVGPFLYVGHVLVKVRQRHRVLLVDLPLHVRLQHWPLIVRKRHGEQSLGVAHKLVDVSLAGHLDGDGQDEVERGGEMNELDTLVCTFGGSKFSHSEVQTRVH